MQNFVIEEASEDALTACFALLPMLAAPDVQIFVARDTQGVLMGAGGMIWRAWGQPAGFPAWIHVLPDMRGQGVGRALFDALETSAHGETHALIAAQPIARGSDAAAFARATGAEDEQNHHYFEMRAQAFHTAMVRLVDRMRAHGQIPANAGAEPLNAENASAVIDLVTAHFNVLPLAAEAAVNRALADDPATIAVDRERTCVVRVGDVVAGVIVARRMPDGTATDIMFRVVAPGFRGSWINAFLLERFFSRLCAQGEDEVVTFDCVESNKDTLKIAIRTGARTLRVNGVWRYALARAPG